MFKSIGARRGWTGTGTRRVVGLFVFVNIIVFLWQTSLDVEAVNQLTYSAGVTPAVLFGKVSVPPELVLAPREVGIAMAGALAGNGSVPRLLTPVSYMFLHAGPIHLLGNLLLLWFLGQRVEGAFGHTRFFLFYLACGVVAGLAHALAFRDSLVPLVGASGAVAGVIAAYLLLGRNLDTVRRSEGRITRLLARTALTAWVGVQVLFLVAASDSGVAWWAHLGGLVAGGLLFFAFQFDWRERFPDPRRHFT